MPQLFQVLRCYKCLVFQIHQIKKSNKWQCKMCGEKQSFKRHYGLGNSKECRLHVQKLNGLRGEKDEEINNLDSDNDYSNSEEENVKSNLVQIKIKTKSKWSTYIENDEVEEQQVSEPMYLGNNEVSLKMPSKQMKCEKRKKLSPTKNGYNFKTPYINESKVITPTIFAHKFIEPVNNVDNVSNNTGINQTTYPHTTSSFKEQKEVVQKSSKWAQFVESDDDIEDNESPAHINTLKDTKKLFQLCDDSDLDDVLNI